MTDLSPELQAELVAFVRDFASHGLNSLIRSGWEIDAAKLVAKLPPPVDPDIEEARKIAADTWLLMGNNTGAQLCLEGGWDREPLVTNALKAVKRGRELERASQ